MSRKILCLASLPLVATSFLSLVATPGSSATLQNQQKLSSELSPAGNSRNSTLVAGFFEFGIDINNWHHDRWRDRDDYRWRGDRDDRWRDRDDYRWRGDRDDRWRGDRDDHWRDRDDYRGYRDRDYDR